MSAEPRPLTGRKVLLIAVAAFAVILAANLAMLLAATGTFPGLVVKNSYVASQGWDRKTEAQRALGWRAAADYGDGTVRVAMTGRDGAPVRGLSVVAVVGRAAHRFPPPLTRATRNTRRSGLIRVLGNDGL